jgi:hypothetical protein
MVALAIWIQLLTAVRDGAESLKARTGWGTGGFLYNLCAFLFNKYLSINLILAGSFSLDNHFKASLLSSLIDLEEFFF